MGIPTIVQNSRYLSTTLTWQDKSGNILDLTGATITGTIKDKETGNTVAITGTLDASANPTLGQFVWQMSAVDVENWGLFLVMFTATFGALPEKTFEEEWVIKEAHVVS
jgi:hypothetical protein